MSYPSSFDSDRDRDDPNCSSSSSNSDKDSKQTEPIYLVDRFYKQADSTCEWLKYCCLITWYTLGGWKDRVVDALNDAIPRIR